MLGKEEKRILKGVINEVAHHDKNAWQRLKWEIFSYGYQSSYSAQSDFESFAKRQLKILTDFERRKLIQLRKMLSPECQKLKDEEIIDLYSYIISEQIVSRARNAAMRTINW